MPAAHVAEAVLGQAKAEPKAPPAFATVVALHVPAAQLPPQAAVTYVDGATPGSYQVPPGQPVHTVFAAATQALEA